MRASNSAPHGQRRHGIRRPRRISRGQAIVEFAMVAPLFFLMLFGFIEFALIGASLAAFNFAAKDAARLGSLLGPTDSTADTQMINLIQSRVGGVVVSSLVKIEIFKSDASGTYNSSVEDSYIFSGGGTSASNWPPDLRNDTLIDADYLGVRITYRYTYLTGFISGNNSTLTLTATSVQRVEPQDYQSRHAPAGGVLLRGPGATNSVNARPPAGASAQLGLAEADAQRRRSAGGVL